MNFPKSNIWFIPAIMIAVGIFALSTFLVVPIQVEGLSYVDKWQHLFAYYCLTFSFLFAFRQAEILSKKRAILILCYCMVYGLLLEFAQFFFFPNRFFEWIDAMANGLGVVIGFGVFKWLFQYGSGE